VEFKPDSSITVNQDSAVIFAVNDAGRYILDSSLLTVLWSKDTSAMPLTIRQLTDSTLDLFSLKDSIIYSLQKRK